MADLTSSAVTITRAYVKGDKTAREVAKVLDVTIVLATQGAGTAGAKIPASAFGLTKFSAVAPFIKSDDAAIYLAVLNTAKTEILIKSETAITTASLTGTFNTTVEGY